MKNNIEGQGKKVIQVLFWLNIIFLAISIFKTSKSLIIFFEIINIILLFTFLMVDNYSSLFSTMMQTQKSARVLNNAVGKLSG